MPNALYPPPKKKTRPTKNPSKTTTKKYQQIKQTTIYIGIGCFVKAHTWITQSIKSSKTEAF